MGPIAKDAMTKYEGKSIELVKFDFTSDETKAASAAKAKELGVSEVYAANEGKTAFALLYDTQQKKVITKLTYKQDVAAWNAAIDSAFGS